MENQKGFIGLPVTLVIVLGIVVLGGGAYFVMQKQLPRCEVYSSWAGQNCKPDKPTGLNISKDYPISDATSTPDQITTKEAASSTPIIRVISWKSEGPATITVEYKNLPKDVKALAVCMEKGGCTEWVEPFIPDAPNGTYTMSVKKAFVPESEKWLGAGRQKIVAIGSRFSEQLLESNVFEVAEVGENNPVDNRPFSITVGEIHIMPHLPISFTSLPSSAVNIKNVSSGKIVWTDDLGKGTGAREIFVPAILMPEGSYIAEAFSEGGIIARSGIFNIRDDTGTLSLGYKNLKFPGIEKIPIDVASGLCGRVFGDYCVWNDHAIREKIFSFDNNPTEQPFLEIHRPIPGSLLSYGNTYTISISDSGPSAGRYRSYLIHRDLLGNVDEIHQASIPNSSLAQNESQFANLTWSLNEVFLDADGKERVSQIPEGTYELDVVNVDSGVSGGVLGTIHIGPKSYSDAKVRDPMAGFKPYAVGTLLVRADSYWNGDGVFNNGGDGEDTIKLAGKYTDYVIFRGVEMPSLNQYNTVVFFQKNSNTVIIIVNTENVAFDDMTIKTANLLSKCSYLFNQCLLAN